MAEAKLAELTGMEKIKSTLTLQKVTNIIKNKHSVS